MTVLLKNIVQLLIRHEISLSHTFELKAFYDGKRGKTGWLSFADASFLPNLYVIHYYVFFQCNEIILQICK